MMLSSVRKFFMAVILFSSVFGIMAARATSVLQQVKTVIMIGFENHNFKQPTPTASPQQIFTNPAAPYINSLITAGNPNATHVSFATRYYNAGTGVHPSEPNYVWEEAGTDFGVHTDGDPTAANGNVFNVEHFTRQMDAAGISWKNFEEDIEYAASPTNSKSGTRPSGTNPYNGSTHYNYQVKHNPMAFFTDSQTKNVYSLTNFYKNLTNNTLGKYNWIMPNMDNCMHDGLSAGFTYHGVVYTGDRAAIAQGDNFLSIIIPQIMASAVFTNNGLIIIRFDETEGGDTTSYSIPEIIISPLAKGNAYASSVVMSHSSDVKTMEEIYGLNYTNSSGANYMSNAIPSAETAATGGHNNVSTVNDLIDLLQEISEINVLQSGVTITNGGSAPAFGSVNVGANATNTFTITNSGAATLVLSNMVTTGTNAGDFTIGGITLPASIIAGGNTTFHLVFSPTAGGSRSAELQITNNDAVHNPFIIALAGVGLAAPVNVGQNMLGTGGFQLIFSGPATQTYHVLATEDLTQPLSYWTVVDSGTFGGTNAIFTDGNATNYPGRFYIIESP
jgi:phosphatidylinositol-3-phosphatase